MAFGKLSRKQWNIRNFDASIMKRKCANYWIADKPLKLERRNIPLTWDGKSTVQGPEEPRDKKIKTRWYQVTGYIICTHTPTDYLSLQSRGH